MRYFVILPFAIAAACAPAPPLASSFASPDALAHEVLDALVKGDEPRLRALALTEDEFRRLVWPRLPAARPERNVPFSYAWGDLRQKSETSLKNLVSRYRGSSFELAGVTFEGRTSAYSTYEIRRKAVFRLRGQDGPRLLRACGSMIVQDGRWKVFSYVVDE